MQLIKFRGRSEKTGAWVYGFLVERHQKYIVEEIMKSGPEYWELVDPETVGQFTGLRDKNGMEVYEGDVIRYEGYDGTIDHAEVVWNQDFLAWMVDDRSGRGLISLYDLTAEKTLDEDTGQFNCDEVEVIGNIHEKTELLEAPDA